MVRNVRNLMYHYWAVPSGVCLRVYEIQPCFGPFLSQPNEQDPAVKRQIHKSLLDKNNAVISTSAE